MKMSYSMRRLLCVIEGVLFSLMTTSFVMGLNYVEIGDYANGQNLGVAVGYYANGYNYGAAVGSWANGQTFGAALGDAANGYNYGAAVGCVANGYNGGAAVGPFANGQYVGAALGYAANGRRYGTAMGPYANGLGTNVAVGYGANCQGGINRIAIGKSVVNNVNNSARIRGNLYLDGASAIYCRPTFGSGNFSAKAFTIDHPLDPENKVLRHYCLEGPVVGNIYYGTAVLDHQGEALVKLPAYFEALNKNPQYLLTPIGAQMNLYVKQEIEDNAFVIGGGAPGKKVCWEVKGERNDPACQEDLRRRPVEQLKSKLFPGQVSQENVAMNTVAISDQGI